VKINQRSPKILILDVDIGFSEFFNSLVGLGFPVSIVRYQYHTSRIHKVISVCVRLYVNMARMVSCNDWKMGKVEWLRPFNFQFYSFRTVKVETTNLYVFYDPIHKENNYRFQWDILPLFVWSTPPISHHWPGCTFCVTPNCLYTSAPVEDKTVHSYQQNN
jgi:hypothetical protein